MIENVEGLKAEVNKWWRAFEVWKERADRAEARIASLEVQLAAVKGELAFTKHSDECWRSDYGRLSGLLAEREKEFRLMGNVANSQAEKKHQERRRAEKAEAEVARLSGQITAVQAGLLDLRKNLAASNRDAWEIVDRILADLSARWQDGDADELDKHTLT